MLLTPAAPPSFHSPLSPLFRSSLSLRQKLTLLFVIPTVDGEICYGCVTAMVMVVVVVVVVVVKNGTITTSNRHPRYTPFHFFPLSSSRYPHPPPSQSRL
jgi:hypothetical protein